MDFWGCSCRTFGIGAALCIVVLGGSRVEAQLVYAVGPRVEPVSATPVVQSAEFAAIDIESLRFWGRQVESRMRTGELTVRSAEPDLFRANAVHQRLDQWHRGVPVFGGELTRELRDGLTVSLGGKMYDGIEISTTPTLSADDIEARLDVAGGNRIVVRPALTIWPGEGSGYLLVYTVVMASADGIFEYFVDAHTGAIHQRVDRLQTQNGISAEGTGVLGDGKKVNVSQRAAWGVYVARDEQRPAIISTYDFGFDWSRLFDLMTQRGRPAEVQLASDPDNVWTDRAVVDVHTYMGWTYDYLYERFGREGLDGRNGHMFAVANAFNPADYYRVPKWVRRYFCNAFWSSDLGGFVTGNGYPSFLDQECGPLAGSFGIVAHELGHGLTRATSNLQYRNESGALNEAFSDILGNGAVWFHQENNSGLPYAANYRLGEAVTPDGWRDMADPTIFNDPNHYGARLMPVILDGYSVDSGWVHTNSSIINHAYYLAIEGGVHKTSGRRVTGVGAARRAEIEQAFYRAFVYKLTRTSVMRQARFWTINQAPTEGARTALREAWDAVGVNENQEVSVQLRNLARYKAGYTCGPDRKASNVWYTTRISTGPTGFSVTEYSAAIYDRYQNLIGGPSRSDAVRFYKFFDRWYVPPYTTVENGFCWTSWKPSSIWIQADVTGRHSTGETVTHYGGRYYLP